MYLREVTSPRKRGPDAVYLQLVEGIRDPKTGKVETRILHSFGRKDRLDTERIRRLAGQLLRYLEEGERPDLPFGVEITQTWDFGGPYLLDALWRELDLDRFFADALEKRSFERPVGEPGSPGWRAEVRTLRPGTSTGPWIFSPRRCPRSSSTSTSR
ncbi:MAG: hypothetical protein ACE5LD_01915 [Candidatus Bipolaricaulia bacterium]